MPSLPTVTRTLLFANLAMYLVELALGDVVLVWLALWPWGAAVGPDAVAGFQPWQVITYSFLHGSVLHLVFNMLALYMFGAELERLFGPRRFINLYFVSVLTAAATQLLVAALSGGEPYPTVGASGGVFGLLLAYAMYFPRRMVMLLIPPIPMPARYFVVLYGALELYLGITSQASGIAHFAHLGGMLGAWLVIRHWRGLPPFRRRPA